MKRKTRRRLIVMYLIWKVDLQHFFRREKEKGREVLENELYFLFFTIYLSVYFTFPNPSSKMCIYTMNRGVIRYISYCEGTHKDFLSILSRYRLG